MVEEDTITISKSSLWKYSTLVLIGVLVIGGFVLFSGNNNPTPNTGNTGNTGAGGGGVAPSEDDDPVLGDPNAPVTIIEFSDYQCPFCGNFYNNALPQIKKNYIDTGKVKLVYRDFPLTSIHPAAQVAAEAAECVRDEGGDEGYFKFHDQIFDNQASLSEASLISWAEDLGYDIESCVSSGAKSSEVQGDLTDGANAGVRGTPAFFIISDSGSQLISGAQPYSVFEQAIESHL